MSPLTSDKSGSLIKNKKTTKKPDNKHSMEIFLKSHVQLAIKELIPKMKHMI